MVLPEKRWAMAVSRCGADATRWKISYAGCCRACVACVKDCNVLLWRGLCCARSAQLDLAQPLGPRVDNCDEI
eukprot:947237-Amphidinium_carterae.1